MRSRTDRLQAAATIVLFAVALGGVVFVAGTLLEDDLLERLAVVVAVTVAVVFAPLYFLFASWHDELEGDGESEDGSGRGRTESDGFGFERE